MREKKIRLWNSDNYVEECALDEFIRCWNIYNGLVYENTGLDRKSEARQTWSEMCVMMGKECELVEGIVIEPDYYPVAVTNMGTDYLMGFNLSIFGHDMGRIINISFRENKMYVVSERITIGLKRDAYYE